MRHPLSDQYRQGRQRLIELADRLTEADGATMTDACPAWSIKDVYAHLAGIATDILTGNTEGAATEAWADGHVAARADRSLVEVVDEWRTAGEQVSDLVESAGQMFPAPLFLDQWTHEWDIRAALGPSAATTPDDSVFEHLLDDMEQAMANDERSADLPRLDLIVGGRTIGVGSGQSVGALALTLFEYGRLSMGRRSMAQIDAYPWPDLADRGRYIDVIVRWSVSDRDIVDPAVGFAYPAAHRHDVVDDYHGRLVADPYRWLEDPESAETKAFVRAQNAITMPYLEQLPERAGLQARMTELWDTERTDPPTVRNGVAIWTHNDGLQDQSVFWIRRQATPEQPAEDEPFLDPNTLSEDGAAAVIVSSLSPDGRHLAYTVAEAGSDRQRLAVRSTETGADLDDRLDHLRFTSVAWFGDGFFYTRWPETDPASTEPVRDPSVHYHRLGDPQDADVLVFHNDDDPDPGYAPVVSQDDRYLVLIEYLGTSQQNGLLYLDLDGFDPAEPAPVEAEDWRRLVDQGEALHSFVLHDDGGFVLHTDRDAPNGRVVRVPLDDPASPTTIIDEGQTAIHGVAAVAGQLMVLRLVEASHAIDRHGVDGKPLGSIDLPGLGTVSTLSGRFDDPDLYIGFQSFVEPGTALCWTAGDRPDDPSSGGDLKVFAAAVPAVDPAKVIVERRHATSSDGRQVGMFVVSMSDRQPGPGPVELYGYGGFSISLTPMYTAARLAFLEAGGTVVIANLRGGTELGEDWHEQGMLGNKQQVFDDLVACAETLIADGVTTAGGLGIRGGSNGGLLTAAAMLQRPDLFGAVISQVPVTDMLRYQHFTAGRFWTVEYGDAADPEAFGWLIEYSPLHNVKSGVDYPPLLITTAESDDRVVPMHSHKFAAEVQHAAGGSSTNPLLLRVETRAGHGLGKPTAKLIEEAADIYAFLLHHLR